MIKPILFNTEMVKAILDGRKTVTRRVIKPHNDRKAKDNEYRQDNGLWVDPDTDNGDHEGHIKDYSISPCWMPWTYYVQKYAPFHPGDILYVREIWTRLDCCSCEGDGQGEYACTPDENDGCHVYRATHEIWGDAKWRPSIHMPKAAARIWLKVTDVRVERLQEIAPEEAVREGVEREAQEVGSKFMVGMFSDIWDSTIKKSDMEFYSWDANPWVWVIEFVRSEKPEET